MLGRPLIHSSPVRRTSTRWNRRQLNDWACLALFLRGEAVCPFERVCYSARISSVLWWIEYVRSGGPLLLATSGSYQCWNQSVFALRLTHLGTLVTGKFTRIWGITFLADQSINWELRLKVSWFGNMKSLVPTKDWLMSPTGSRGGLTISRPVEAAPKKAVQRVVSYLLVCPDWSFSCFSSVVGANSRVYFRGGRVRLPQSWRRSAKMSPPFQVAEAISQSDSNPSWFNSQKSIQLKFFSCRTSCLMGSSSYLSSSP
jgi:hypothetical protein